MVSNDELKAQSGLDQDSHFLHELSGLTLSLKNQTNSWLDINLFFPSVETS